MENDISDDILKTLERASEYGTQATMQELTELFKAVLTCPGEVVVEVGSASGGTTVVLIEAANLVNKSVISIDPYPESLGGKALFYRPGIMPFWKQKFKENILDNGYKNISQINESTEDCIDQIPDNLSVVFIDGLHEYECVKKEYELLFPRVVSGGMVFIHDTLWNVGQNSKSVEGGVAKIKELLPDAVDFGNMIGVKQ